MQHTSPTTRRFLKSRICWSALVALLVSTSTFTLFSNTASASTGRFYSATGHSVKGSFLKFYDTYGGIPIIGYPISEEVVENGRPVQYFERQRMEYHVELAGTENEVQLSLLGVGKVRSGALLARAAFVSNPNTVYFGETGHSLSYSFLKYWNSYGDLRVFGYPITEPVNENGYTVQYFQRARMEYHPEKSGISYGVELGHLGKEYLQSGATSASVGGSPQQSVPVTQSALTNPAARDLMSFINGARQSGGLAPVTIDMQLTDIAAHRSNDMATRNYFSHVTPEGTDFLQALKAASISYKLGGEILEKNNYTSDTTVRAAYDTYMNSPAHRSIIMDGRYNNAGVGVSKDAKGFSFYTVIFTQK